MNRLKELRREKGLLQKEVAQKIGVSPQSYSFYENWINKPDPETLIKLADIYEVSVDYLLGRTDDLGNIITVPALPFEGKQMIIDYKPLSIMEQRLILDFRKLPAETQDNFVNLFHNLAMGA